MICLIICFIVGLLCGIYFYLDSNEFFTAFKAFIGGFLICFIGLILIGDCINSSLDIEKSKPYEEIQYRISGLENKTLSNFDVNGEYIGAFTIGYGVISADSSTEMNYWYFKESEYGKILESIPCKDVYIREVDDGDICLIHVTQDTIIKGNPTLNKIFLYV